MNTSRVAPTPPRLVWPDIVRGVSILWIAFFHFFITYDNGRYPWPLSIERFLAFVSQCSSSSGTLGCTVDALFAALFERGSQAVGVFLVLSGFGLTYSLAKTGHPPKGWAEWYWKRLLRLFPLYWAAHLIYVVSPFAYRHHPVDYRFLLSLLGDRIFPVDTMFYYLNPAWWYFGLLLQLVLVYPVLFGLLRKMGPGRFLILCGLFTLLTRYVLHNLLHAHGNYMQGAFFGGRLWDFAAGMVLAGIYRQNPGLVEQRLFSPVGFLSGIAMYVAGVYSYQPTVTYIWSDGLIATGLFVILAHVARWISALPPLGRVFSLVGFYSYGIYLLHQPYVMYFGKYFRGFSMPVYVLFACGVLAVVCVGAISLEWALNLLVSRLEGKRKVAASPASSPAN